MKKIDVFRLAWREMIQDKRNICLNFLLEALLFSNVIILLLFTLELDSVFDSYCHEHIEGVYDATVINAEESELPELEQDGFRDMELWYDETEGHTLTDAKIDSLKGIEYKLIKWRSRGVVIRLSMQEVVSVMVFVKAIFCFISILGILLCVLATGNFYQIKIQKRIRFIKMLIRIGMPSKRIGQIYRIPFFIMNTGAVMIAYILSFPVLSYFNRLIGERFGGLSLGTEKREALVLSIYVIAVLVLCLSLRNLWKKVGKGNEKE